MNDNRLQASPKRLRNVCGVDCHPGDAACNGYCRDGRIPAPGFKESQAAAPQPVLENYDHAAGAEDAQALRRWHWKGKNMQMGEPVAGMVEAADFDGAMEEVLKLGARVSELRPAHPAEAMPDSPTPPVSPTLPPRVSPSPAMEAARAAQHANRAAREEAQSRGTPERERDILMNATEAPEVPGYGRPCRMTPAMRQIMVRWSKLPDECKSEDLCCLALAFLKPRRAWLLLQAFDEKELAWTDDTAAELWRNEWMALAFTFMEQNDGGRLQEEVAAWINAQVNSFFS